MPVELEQIDSVLSTTANEICAENLVIAKFAKSRRACFGAQKRTTVGFSLMNRVVFELVRRGR